MEADGWPSAWSAVPLRSVVHVPHASSLLKSTALTPWCENTAFQRSTACGGIRSASQVLERIE